MLVLRSLPDLTDNQYWRHSDDGNTVLWPADDGDEHITVRINTAALSEYDGVQFSIDICRTTAALNKHREVIQQQARLKSPSGGIVTLDREDFPARN